MALSPLDSNVALVVIDLQKGIVSMPTLHSIEPIIDRAASLAREFRERGLPVVLVNVTGGAPGRTSAARPAFTPPPGWAELVPQLEPSAADHLVSKQRWGAFLGTDLDSYLRGRGVTQIVLLGVATSIGVESTARSAYSTR
jgi:nicotinamidase-related amidase